jgi:RNA polymerase sigma-70 factor (ECF subfamily)
VIARMADDGADLDDPSADEALVRAARADLAAFAPLYNRYHDAIYGYSLRRLGDREAAGDATSLTFTRAMTALHRFRGGSFRAWLFAIAHNVVIDAVRRRRFHDDLDAAGPIADRQPSPEDHAVASDQRRHLVDALAKLTPDQRTVVELRVAGLTGPEIATALGLSLGSVKSLQFRAYARLRALLGDIDPTGDA